MKRLNSSQTDKLEKTDASSLRHEFKPSSKRVKIEVKAHQRRIQEQRKQIDRDMQAREVEAEKLT
ncbi:hypothetical protein EON65_51070 [archaeon]|nr:MAG: hypothetical protein EON65_51070 [archaeon]